MEIIYRTITLDDAYGIEYVSAHSWKETYSGFMPDDYLNSRVLNINNKIQNTKKFLGSIDRNTYYVAEVDKKIVGILYYTKSDSDKFINYGHLNAIYVLKEYQGLGIGKQLFKLAIQGIIDLGYNAMYLECIKGNQTLEFYKKYSGKVIDMTDYKIRDFSLKVDIVEFKDIKKILKDMIDGE